MKLNILFIVVVILFSTQVFSQETQAVKDAQAITRGREIIENARKSIKVDKPLANFTSLHISTKSQGDSEPIIISEEEVSLIMPDQVLRVYSMIKPLETKMTSIWNGEKYKKLSEVISFDGKRIVRDITNVDTVKILSTVLKDEKQLENFKKAASADPKVQMKDQLWNQVFPFVLIHPLEKQAEFKFVGKAKAGDVEVNIVDTTTENGHSIRLFFDTKTNYLLRMTEKYQRDDGNQENNYYYSERETVDGVLIPKKIKTENKVTPTGGETKTYYTYTDVVEFKINPKLKPELFKVN